jgi:hypothetical protein
MKLIRQFRGAKKISRGSKLPKILSKNTVFQNPRGVAAPPPGLLWIRHCLLSVTRCFTFFKSKLNDVYHQTSIHNIKSSKLEKYKKALVLEGQLPPYFAKYFYAPDD